MLNTEQLHRWDAFLSMTTNNANFDILSEILQLSPSLTFSVQFLNLLIYLSFLYINNIIVFSLFQHCLSFISSLHFNLLCLILLILIFVLYYKQYSGFGRVQENIANKILGQGGGGGGGECTDIWFIHSNTEEVKRRERGGRGFVGRAVCIYAAGSHISCVQVTLV